MRADPAKQRPVLIILHQENSIPGRVGVRLIERGYKLDQRRPRFGDTLPDTLDEHSAAVIFGGPSSSNDPDEFIKIETDWISVPLKEKRPLLGLCLGAQMFANHIGGQTRPHQHGQVEVGYYPIEPTVLAESLVSDWPRYVYQWHREWLEVPDSTDLLAVGKAGHHQAFKVGECAFGLQFHPEVTRRMVHRWTTKGHERLTLPGAQSRQEHIKGRFMHDGPVNSWLDGFLDHWLSQDSQASASYK